MITKILVVLLFAFPLFGQDKSFWVANGILAASEIADIETTVRFPPNVYESHSAFLYGTHPTRLSMYPVMLGLHAGLAFLSHKYLKKHNLYLAPYSLVTADHIRCSFENSKF